MSTSLMMSRLYGESGLQSTLSRWENCKPSSFSEVVCSLVRLIDFFRFFSHDFQFNNSVLSLRAGQLTKESKGWVNDVGISDSSSHFG